MSESEVRVRKAIIDGKTAVFIDRIDRKNQKYESLNHDGEWQEVALYQHAPPKTIFRLCGEDGGQRAEAQAQDQR